MNFSVCVCARVSIYVCVYVFVYKQVWFKKTYKVSLFSVLLYLYVLSYLKMYNIYCIFFFIISP